MGGQCDTNSVPDVRDHDYTSASILRGVAQAAVNVRPESDAHADLLIWVSRFAVALKTTSVGSNSLQLELIMSVRFKPLDGELLKKSHKSNIVKDFLYKRCEQYLSNFSHSVPFSFVSSSHSEMELEMYRVMTNHCTPSGMHLLHLAPSPVRLAAWFCS